MSREEDLKDGLSYLVGQDNTEETRAEAYNKMLEALLGKDEALILRVAKAVEGPFKPVSKGSRYTLDQLRDVRWNMLTHQDKGLRRLQAQAILAELHKELSERKE